MANIKSAKKRILVNRTKAERNKSIRSAVKTAIKKVEVAVVNKDKETAVNALGAADSYHQQSCIERRLSQKQRC